LWADTHPLALSRCASSGRSTTSTVFAAHSGAPGRRASSGAPGRTTWQSSSSASCCAATARCRRSGSTTSAAPPLPRPAPRGQLAATMGQTAENLHDRFPQLTKDEADAYAVRSHHRLAEAWRNGVMRETVVPMAVHTDSGWREADGDEFLRPGTSLGAIRDLPTPFRAGGRVTAGNSAGLTDGATVSLLASGRAAGARGLEPTLRLGSFSFAGVEPELMGIGPVPATRRVL